MDRISESLLDRAVTGVSLIPGCLRDQLQEGPNLLVFLRFFGCIFCREAVGDLRSASESEIGMPPVLFFSQASSTEIRAFLRRYWPRARAISDPSLEFYDAFGVGRASFLQAFGPKVFAARSRAVAKGYENGPTSGDIWRMPGAFVSVGERIVWSYKPRHGADHPDFASIPKLLDGLEGRVEDHAGTRHRAFRDGDGLIGAATTGTLSHIDISVGYPERSIPFYEAFFTALGYRRRNFDDPAWQGPHPTRATWSLKTEVGSFGVEVRPAREESRDRRYDRYEPGPHHIAFHAADPGTVDRVYEAMRAVGAEVLDPPVDYSGQRGYTPGYYAVFFADPDGLKLEVAHIPPKGPTSK